MCEQLSVVAARHTPGADGGDRALSTGLHSGGLGLFKYADAEPGCCGGPRRECEAFLPAIVRERTSTSLLSSARARRLLSDPRYSTSPSLRSHCGRPRGSLYFNRVLHRYYGATRPTCPPRRSKGTAPKKGDRAGLEHRPPLSDRRPSMCGRPETRARAGPASKTTSRGSFFTSNRFPGAVDLRDDVETSPASRPLNRPKLQTYNQ